MRHETDKGQQVRSNDQLGLAPKRAKLPAPRLQLRWEPLQRARYQWQCNYELVILLDEWDVRREIYKNGQQLKKKLPRECAIPMKGPSLRCTGSNFPPCTSHDGKLRYADEPFRDGAHARWDAIQLGDLPIYVVAPDGMTFQVEYDADKLRAANSEKKKA